MTIGAKRFGFAVGGHYIYAMSVLSILLVLAMAATVVVLVLGLVSMVRGDNPRRSNKLMQLRIALQGLALIIFAIVMMSRHG